MTTKAFDLQIFILLLDGLKDGRILVMTADFRPGGLAKFPGVW